MTQLLVSQIINAPMDAVWPLVSDITKHSQWSPKPYSVEHKSGVKGEVGSTYLSMGFVPPAEKKHQNDVEITEIIPGSKIVFTSHDKNGYFKSTFKLEKVSQGTLVTFQHDFPKMKGIARILLPLLLPITGKRDAILRLGKLKAIAEAR